MEVLPLMYVWWPLLERKTPIQVKAYNTLVLYTSYTGCLHLVHVVYTPRPNRTKVLVRIHGVRKFCLRVYMMFPARVHHVPALFTRSLPILVGWIPEGG